MLLISPNFDVKSIIFPSFGKGHLPKIAGKSPVFTISTKNQNLYACLIALVSVGVS